MTKYNTNNPVGSADPRDLYDTATVADNLVNGGDAAYPDRLGVSRRSWQSVEDQADQQEVEFNSDQVRRESEHDADQSQRVSEFDAAQSDRQGVFRQYLISAGYQFAGDYAAGIEVTQYNQVLRDINGEFWRASGSTTLPYTTTGAGLPEGGAFVAAGDAVLRQELGQSVAGQGVDLVKGITRRPTKSLGYYMGKMQSGAAVKFVAYGDSTTDGNGTSAWTSNTIGTDHNPDAPNAWPVKLEALLRDMYNNASIDVHNAGFSGQRLDNGWAYDNYQAAVIDNPFYGTPDVCFIGFGLNDIVSTASTLESHRSETIKLINRMMVEGTLPVIITTHAHWRSGDDLRQNIENSRELDAMKVSIGQEYGVPVIDVNKAFKDWLAVNTDGYNAANEMPDALHYGDNGHAFIAGFKAKELFRDIFEFDGRRTMLPTFDSRSQYIGSSDDVYNTREVRQGQVASFPAGAPTNTACVTAWVWNVSPFGSVIYRGVGDEFYDETSLRPLPALRITETIEGQSISKTPSHCGVSEDSLYSRSSDIPYKVGRLKYGLSKIEIVNGAGSSFFFGYLEFIDSNGGKRDALKSGGALVNNFSGTGAQAYYATECKDMSNTYGLMRGDSLELLLDFSLPQECGFLLHGKGSYSPSSTVDRCGLMLFRHSSDVIRVYGYTDRSDTGISFSNIIFETPSPISWGVDNRAKIRLKMSSNFDDSQTVEIFEGWSNITPLVTKVTPPASWPLLYGGVVGGFFYNGDVAAEGYCEARSVIIKESN